jgi:hypothetical protein
MGVPLSNSLTTKYLVERATHIVDLLYSKRDYSASSLSSVFTPHAYLDLDGNISTLYESQLDNHEWLARAIPKCRAVVLHASATISKKTSNGQVVLTLAFPSAESGLMRGGHISAKWKLDSDDQWRCCSWAMLFGPQGLPF